MIKQRTYHCNNCDKGIYGFFHEYMAHRRLCPNFPKNIVVEPTVIGKASGEDLAGKLAGYNLEPLREVPIHMKRTYFPSQSHVENIGRTMARLIIFSLPQGGRGGSSSSGVKEGGIQHTSPGGGF